jgi:hypothetical protein
MAKRKGRRAGSKSDFSGPQEEKRAFEWVPLWGWVLIFLLPLIASELMFWNVGKIPSMVMFPIAWVGFWYITMERAGWPILKNRKEKSAANEEGD